jgi:flagellar P-ring protein precursor FlgI
MAFLTEGALMTINTKTGKLIRYFISVKVAMVFIGLLAFQGQAARIKDMADIKGVRPNQLVGYGLVVGLAGSGDGKKSKFTLQSMASMLEKMGITVKPEEIRTDNVAAVMVTAMLPPFARAGSRIDGLVSSIGDAETLQGGTLLLTPLKGVDGRVYGVAQGPVSTGGFTASGAGAAVQKNFPTVGRVAGGVLVEREIEYNFNGKRAIELALHNPDFTTASRMVSVINEAFPQPLAQTPDAGTIAILVPDEFLGKIVDLVTKVENLEVKPDVVAKVVINERTGTVVMGENVRISTIAIAHGSLSIEIKESADVSQPLPFGEGRTVVTPNTNIGVQEEAGQLYVVESGVSIGDVVRALNALGVTPRDLIAILQAIKAAGAMPAALEII